MNLGVRILCRAEVAAGFGLTGLPVVPAATSAEAAEECRRWLTDPSVGVVLVEQEYHDQLPEEIRHQLSRRPLPMVVPFPGPAWQEKAEAADSYIVELLRQVIGYRVRLR
jgi:vacuolar-type H+-ATPase subunit F/Vma7